MAYADNTTGSRTILSTGCGDNPRTVTLGEACRVGDVLGYSSGWKRALATAGSVIQGRLVALSGGKPNEVIPVSPNPVVGGVTGATAGNYIYVAEGALYGQTTETAPDTSTDATTKIGIALSATEIMFFLNSRADSTAT